MVSGVRDEHRLRRVEIIPGVLDFAAGSAEIKIGRTRVLCAATIEDRVPPFLSDTGEGWVTAEYSMLPAATGTRSKREAVRGRQGGRTMEIQRLIGRSLRAVTRRDLLGERTITIDCDVLQADGGTRCASITGGFVALAIAVKNAAKEGILPENILLDSVAAISVGLKDNQPVVDPDYALDSKLDVDANFVVTGRGKLVEVQATAEGRHMSPAELSGMVELAIQGCADLAELQAEVLQEFEHGE
ncbi:MAG: ribonuclease PH [Deltaproteobacteria bacterium]|nr:ribonuclease PH [Deltaproteobacteria bacterium]